MADSFEAIPTYPTSETCRVEYLRNTLLEGGIAQLAEVGFHVGNTARPRTSIQDLEPQEKKDFNDATKFVEDCVSELFDKHQTQKDLHYTAKDEVAALRFQLDERDEQILASEQELAETQKRLDNIEVEHHQATLDKEMQDRLYRLIHAQRNIGVKKIKEFLAVWKAAAGHDFTNKELADFEAFLMSCDAFIQHQSS